MGKLNVVYGMLPAGIRNIAISSYGYILHKKRYGKIYRKYYAGEKKNASLSEQELQRIQLKKLKELLRESIQYSDYYRHILENSGVTSEAIEKAEDSGELLRRIPVLEKNILREHMGEIVSRSRDRKKYSVTHTSGSTGTPMTVEQDKEAIQYSFSLMRRFYDWMGLPDHFKSARLSGRIVVAPEREKPPFWVYNSSDKQLFMSTYHLTENNLAHYIKKLNSFRPELIDGYPSAVKVIAEYVIRNKIELEFRPKAVATTAETLTEDVKELIQKAFCCPVYDQYASSEGAPFACQCREGNMHLWIDTGVFEFTNREQMTEELERAEVIVTSFRSKKTPLIRYAIGDGMILYRDKRVCPCGCRYPIVHSVEGRMDDILYTREKGYVGRLDTAYKGVEGITESQIVQDNLDTINVYIVKNNYYNENQERILYKNLQDRLGTDIDIHFIYVSQIQRGANGKFRTVIRKFKMG